MKNIFCSSKIKDNINFNLIESTLTKHGLCLDSEVGKIIVCERSELSFYKEKAKYNSSIICIEMDESLFYQDVELFDENYFVYLLKQGELAFLDEVLKLNIYAQEEIAISLNEKKIISTIEVVNSFEFKETPLVLDAMFNIKAFLSIYKSIEIALENYNFFLESMNKKYRFSLLTQKELSKAQNIIPLCDKFHIEIKADFTEISSEDSSIILTSLSELQSFYEIYGIKNEESLDTYWQSIFSVFPIPMAIITTNGELLYHNNLFSKLEILPKQCIELDNNQKTEINNEYYACHKEQVEFEDDQLFYFSFIGAHESEENKQGSSHRTFEDLGIVSSSIAHELNNPLAGILSALEVLVLIGEDNEDVQNMKKAANRCKELVSVFLGFARTHPTLGSEKKTVESLFLNALTLLRFRMVEANIRLEIEVVEVNNSETIFNSSILTMIFYLILNDIMTAYQHEKLIADDDDDQTIIRGSFCVNQNQISIKLFDDFISIKEVEFNKLVPNLLQLEDLGWKLKRDSLCLES